MNKEEIFSKRIAVFSDTHGNRSDMREALQKLSGIDCIIHLGDGVIDGKHVSEEFMIPFYGICGNEDFNVSYPEKLLLRIAFRDFYFMHGHQYEINAYQTKAEWVKHYKDFACLARDNGANALFFGHTHDPVLVKYDGIIICNPGDQYIGASTPPSFAEISIDTVNNLIGISLYEKKDADWIVKDCMQV